MATDREFVTHCMELLSPLGSVRSRRMFGGHGFYVDDLFLALIAFERLYLKADAQTRPRFEAAGCEPFVYDGQGKSVTLGYFTAPEDAMESPALMLPWARLAMASALRAANSKRPAAPRKAPAKPRAKPPAKARPKPRPA